MDARDPENKKLAQLLQEKEALLKQQAADLQRLSEQLAAAEQKLSQVEAQHVATAEQFSLSIEQKNQEIRLLQAKIKQLLRTVRGSRQERINPDQLLLFNKEELEEIASELEQAASSTEDEEPKSDEDENKRKRKPKKGHGRRQLPANMPREIKRHELSEDERKCPCCGELREEIGIEASEQLEFVPARFKVIEHQRVKYACKGCQENVAVAPKPPQPIEKGIAGPSLLAHVTVSKFGDHLPLYREEDLFDRVGFLIRRSTICGWLFELAALVMPLVMRMKYLVLQSKVIHTDDTKIKMLQPEMCLEARFWPYLGDWLHRYAVYDFTLDRSRDGPLSFLEGYRGYLQADAFSGYDRVFGPDRAIEVACWVHARRYWHDALEYDSVRANTALGFIARLSQIESQLEKAYPYANLQGERNFDAVAAGRQQHALPILNHFREWMDQELSSGKVLPKSIIAKAFTYTTNQWTALCRYVEQGYLSLDNNAAERTVKYPAIGRKNYLFVGSEQAGRNAAAFYSLIVSAKLNGVEPLAWLTDVYRRLPAMRGTEAFRQCQDSKPVESDELDSLLPDRWLADHPGHRWQIDHLRRNERDQKSRNSRPKRRRR
jgi:transposase